MDIDEYQAAVLAALMCSRLLEQHDFPAVLAAIEHADAVGPMLHTTVWIAKHKAMHEDRETLKAALPLYLLGKKLAEMRAEKAQ